MKITHLPKIPKELEQAVCSVLNEIKKEQIIKDTQVEFSVQFKYRRGDVHEQDQEKAIKLLEQNGVIVSAHPIFPPRTGATAEERSYALNSRRDEPIGVSFCVNADMLKKLYDSDKDQEKETIVLHDENGMYSDSNPTRIYKVQKQRAGHISGRYKLLIHFIKKGNVSMYEMRQIFDTDNTSDIQKQWKGINTLFKKHLQKKEDLIILVGTGGYTINPKFNLIHTSDT